MTVKLLTYKEGVYSIINITEFPRDGITINVSPKMKYDIDGVNNVVLQLTVYVNDKDDHLVKYGGIAVYEVNSLSNIVKDEEQIEILKSYIWKDAISFFRGILCEKLRGTIFSNIFLPEMPEDALQNLKFEQE